jgi:hypothetical protein
MTYWTYNPQSLEDVEMEGKPTFEDLERCEIKGLLIFYNYHEVMMRKKDDERFSIRRFDEKVMTWHDEVSEMDLSELLNLSSVNNEIKCFETVEPKLVNQTELVNQISKSKRGGKREGAGSKKGISKSNEHKDKISKSMQGKRNAVKNN